MSGPDVPVWVAYAVIGTPVLLVALYIIDKVRKDRADE